MPIFVAASVLVLAAPLAAQQDMAARYRAVADSIIREALSDSAAWNRLAEMVDQYGPRITGSAALEQSIDWIVERMRADGLDRVRTEDVTVEHWVRGEESAAMPSARSRNVMGAIIGRERPDEVVVIGWHIDSWDVDRARGTMAAACSCPGRRSMCSGAWG